MYHGPMSFFMILILQSSRRDQIKSPLLRIANESIDHVFHEILTAGIIYVDLDGSPQRATEVPVFSFVGQKA
jgi:hypothetical protein